jgi:putative transposase
MIDVLRSYAFAGRFVIHDFVIMPDHVHILLTIPGDLSIERAVQLIKGGFSFRAKKEIGFNGEVWQKGFAEEGVRDRSSFLRHRAYIEQNPAEAGLAKSSAEYPYSSACLKEMKRMSVAAPEQGLKPES